MSRPLPRRALTVDRAAGTTRGTKWRRGRPPRATLLETYSPHSGRIRVEQRGAERRLLVGGEVQSVYITDDDWSRLAGEYWARALASPLPPRPRVLFVGLGGATQVHLLRQRSRPRLITVIERDAIVMGIAQEWFGLRSVGKLEVLCADAARAIRQVEAARRRFDFIMDDISYATPVEEAVRTARALARLLASRGRLVLNQHEPADARSVAAALRDVLPLVWTERVQTSTANLLIFGQRHGAQMATASVSE